MYLEPCQKSVMELFCKNSFIKTVFNKIAVGAYVKSRLGLKKQQNLYFFIINMKLAFIICILVTF